MGFLRRKVRRDPGAYGNDVPRYPERGEPPSNHPPDNDDIEGWRDITGGRGNIVQCFRCGERFLIEMAPGTFRAQCRDKWGVNAILDDLCGELVKKNRKERNAVNDKIRRQARY